MKAYQNRMLKAYYNLTKPGIIYGNALTTVGGFLLASRGKIHLAALLAVLTGTSLIIACGCVLNNYIDRDIDKKMSRTKKRALVTGLIPVQNALIFATALGVGGFVILAIFTNQLTVIIGVIALLTYVVLYGVGKRRSVHGTLIGSIAGAAPPVAGYCAASGRMDLGAVLVGIILILWQMPHFYAIAMYRRDDYAAAKIPVLPIVKGMKTTKLVIVLYIMAFIGSTLLLSIFGYAGFIFMFVMALLGLFWLWLGIQGLRAHSDTVWARKMFLFSLVVILSLSVMLSAGSILP